MLGTWLTSPTIAIGAFAESDRGFDKRGDDHRRPVGEFSCENASAVDVAVDPQEERDDDGRTSEPRA